MIASITGRMPRGVLFLALNISLLFSVVIFLLAPLLAHFASRDEEISESAAQLAHFRKIARGAGTLTNSSSLHGGDAFLTGSEERIVSADLQANLKTIAANAGANLLGIRGLQGGRYQQSRMVAVGVELEGSLAAVRDMVVAIENQTPFLFVTAASFRNVSDSEEGPIRAELKVEGAMREAKPTGVPEAGSK